MTDTIDVPTPSATITETAPNPTTTDSQLVSRPLNQPKPYDDEVFDSYEATADDGPGANGVPALDAKGDPGKGDAEPAKEASKEDESAPEEKAEGGKSKAGDKVEDNFEKVIIEKEMNGKPFKFTVADAIQAKMKQEDFNRNMDRRLTHVSQREKRWETEQSNLKNVLGRVIESAQTGDFVTTIRALAKMAAGSSGLDVTKFEKQYFDQLEKVREVYTKMTPTEREAYFAKRALADSQARTKELEEEKSATAEKSHLQTQVESLQKQHSIPNDEFWGSYKQLTENAVGEGKAFKAPEEIKAEDVVQYSLMVRHEGKVIAACKKAGITDEATLNELSKITVTDPTLTVDDMVKVLAQAGVGKTASPEAVENLNRKAAKSNTRPNSQASSTRKENGKIEGYDQESLDFLYRKQPRVFSRPVR